MSFFLTIRSKINVVNCAGLTSFDCAHGCGVSFPHKLAVASRTRPLLTKSDALFGRKISFSEVLVRSSEIDYKWKIEVSFPYILSMASQRRASTTQSESNFGRKGRIS